jgi:hypothetical protein
MKPIEFKGSNVVYGANQPEYQPLPAMKLPDGTVYTCWELSDEDIQTITKNKCIYFSQLTFNQALQPVMAMAELGDNIEMKG